MHKSLPLFALLALVLGLAACEKDTQTTETVTLGAVAGAFEPTAISAFGVLTDDLGRPVADAVVRAGDVSAVTNADGYWRLDDVDAGVSFGYFAFESPGHLDGSRTVYAAPGGRYELDVELLSRAEATTVDAAAGGSVELDGGAAVTFGAGAFARTDGTPVTGAVTVHAHYLDPAAEATYRQMPGDLRGRPTGASSDADLDFLKTYGMMAVELTDAGGAEVVLADGQMATLRMPLPPAARASAPATIPLWFFDEDAGVWLEEGTATREGDAYVGEVSHFTFWNCDIPTDAVQLCGQIDFEDGSPGDTARSHVSLAVVSENWGTTYGYTDADGSFCGLVPAGEALTLEVRDWRSGCQGPVASYPLGSLSADTELGVRTVPAAGASLVTVAGSGDCQGGPVTDGVAYVELDGRRVATVALEADGTFETSFVACGAGERTYALTVVDYASLSQSAATPLTSAGAEVDFGTVAACEEELDNFIRFNVDGRDFLFFDAGGFVGTDTVSVGSESECAFASVTFYDFAEDLGVAGPKTIDADAASTLSIGEECDNSLPPGINFTRISLAGRALDVTASRANGDDRYAARIAPWEYTVPLDSTGRDTTYTLALDFVF